MRRQHKQPVHSAHLAPVVNRTATPCQSPWQGPPPAGVDAVLARNALDAPYVDFFAAWASNLALLNAGFAQNIYQSQLERMLQQFANNRWVRYKVYDLAQCDVGPHDLWIKKQIAGWTVELRYSCDIDTRVLTLAKMPILCPDELSAARLALACYPNPVAGMIWHPYS